MNNRSNTSFLLALLSTIMAIALIIGIFWAFPQYRVYAQTLRGEAALREAEWDRKIAIEEAEAEKISASLHAEAEIIRARGVAEANEIIGESLQNGE